MSNVKIRKTVPQPIQLALQGGGAKIAALLAAGQGIQNLEKKGTIKITRIAGTSAGSIVATFLGAGIDIAKVRENLISGWGIKLIEKFPTPNLKTVAWKIWRGKSIWNTDPLKDWLNHWLKDTNFLQVSDFVKHNSKDVIIVKTDLGNRSATTANANENIVNAIIDSCALPFLFRVWHDDGPIIVDGGICANLPIEQLERNIATDGPIIAVSFKEKLPSQPTNFLQFALSILDSAISTTMVQTKNRIKENAIYVLNTNKIDTFSFNNALNFLESENEYTNLVKETEQWFQKFSETSDWQEIFEAC